MMLNIGFVIAILLFACASKIHAGDVDLKGRLLTPEEGCGFTKVKNSRIVGGSEAPVGSFPWMTLLGRHNQFFDKIKLSFFCGGSLITSKHVLTAAHCCAAQTRLKFVRLGEHDLRTEDGHHQDILVARSVPHENFDPYVKANDIAILHLERDVEFSDRIRPICVPTEEPILSRVFTDQNPWVAGWGDVENNARQSSQVLKQLQVPVIDNQRCKDLVKAIGVTMADIQITDSKICAGIYDGENFWDGDSGGPLMLPIHLNGSFPFYQIGVVSYSYTFARENVPGIYTKVQYYADWIKKHIDP